MPVMLSKQALEKLRDIKRRVFSDGDEPVDDDRILHAYDMVIASPTTTSLNSDGTVNSKLKYPDCDNDTLQLVVDGTCDLIEVNSIPDAP